MRSSRKPALPSARIFHLVAASLLILSGCQAGPTPQKVSHPSAPTVTLALLGDVMLGRGVRPSAETFAYLSPFIASADLGLANLESPLTIAPVQSLSPYVLCAPPERVSFLSAAGLDLLVLANNHRNDCGEQGVEETRSVLIQAGLGFVDSGTVFRTINGVSLAFLALDATGRLNTQAAVQAVRSARESADVVIVSVHWGTEYQSGPSAKQQRIAGVLSQAGAALIWGHHPHVLQPAEWINGGRTLVLYSLGNALFDQYGLAGTRQSALLLVTVDCLGVKNFRAIPFGIDVPHSRVVKPSPADRQTILQYFPPQQK